MDEAMKRFLEQKAQDLSQEEIERQRRSARAAMAAASTLALVEQPKETIQSAHVAALRERGTVLQLNVDRLIEEGGIEALQRAITNREYDLSRPGRAIRWRTEIIQAAVLNNASYSQVSRALGNISESTISRAVRRLDKRLLDRVRSWKQGDNRPRLSDERFDALLTIMVHEAPHCAGGVDLAIRAQQKLHALEKSGTLTFNETEEKPA